jgi:mevalonate kinase
MSKEIKDSIYYYDIKQFNENDTYLNILLLKIISAKKLLRKLVIELDMQDTERINKIFKAIKFNEDLIKELGYSQKDIQILLDEYKKLN